MLQKDKQYEKAAICYKKMLVVSWFYNDKVSEIAAYQCLSMQYLYLAEIKNSLLYNERASRGIVEADHSQNKQIAKYQYQRSLNLWRMETLDQRTRQIAKEFGLKRYENVIVEGYGGNVIVDTTFRNHQQVLDYIVQF